MAPADANDDLLLQIRPLLDMSKPELQNTWRELDSSDVEPAAKFDLLAAILCRLLRGASDLDSAQSQLSSRTSPFFSFFLGYAGIVFPSSDDEGTERTWFEP